ncbi:alkaline phosphatase-like protein [Marasmius fiardii PR-910]|nr:alkaline phosphatase-like protein [Marasmius fiardii PR-910]
MFRSHLLLLFCTAIAGVFCRKPNIILIITDDQDVRTGTLDFMPRLRSNIAEKGTTYERFYAPVSLCCPSRVSLLRAQYAHNHNITYVSGDFGGYHLFCEKGHNEEYLPVYLQQAGYGTYYTGKLMNGLSYDQIATQPPKGWTHSDFLVDPNAYLYYNASFSSHNAIPVNYEGQFQVDVVLDKALGLLDEALDTSQNGRPFFLGIAPTAPHLEVSIVGSRFTEPIPRKGDEKLFEDVQVPRSPSFNVKPEGAVSWLKNLEELNQTVVDYTDHVHRQRLRVLQPVDEFVEAIVNRVEQAGPEVSDNTYIIYTSDNGYALGSHRRLLGKTLPYEEDVLVPLVIRGPHIPANTTNKRDVYSMPDLGATILGLAGVTPTNYTIDGTDFLTASNARPKQQEESGEAKPRHTLVEYWNAALEEGIYARPFQLVNTTYRSIHVKDDTDGRNDHDWIYGVWCTGERELYDFKTDPYQLRNLAQNDDNSSFSFSSPSITRIASRLDGLLIVLKTCTGEVCRDPWRAFNVPDVSSLSGALDARFDAYFDSLPRFGYKDCRFGYFGEVNEFPVWSEELAYRD